MKKLYYSVMFDVTDFIMWLNINDREHWARWWQTSQMYRIKRDAA